MCLQQNIVYSIQCSCGKRYIGSSVRHFHTRFKEHMTREHSSVYKHHQSCPGTLSTTILARDENATNLRFKEALLIAQQNPELNNKMECEELAQLTF